MKLTHAMILGALSGSGKSNQGKRLAQAIQNSQTKTRNFNRMSDVANWIHRKMVTNPGSADGKKLIQLKQRYVDKIIDSFPGPEAPMNNIFGLATGMSAEDLAAENEAILALGEFLLHWINMVNTGKKWDYKNHPHPNGIADSLEWEYDAVSKLFYRRDLWGNVHYGFVGRAVGFSRQVLRQGGGAAQLFSDLSNGRYSNVKEGVKRLISDFDGFASFDPPDDLNSVEFGAVMYDKYGLNLTAKMFLDEVRRSASQLPTKK